MGMGFATQYSALPMYRRMQGWVWIFFSGIMALAFFTIYFTYPETKGVSTVTSVNSPETAPHVGRSVMMMF
jgi:hypothetical protein